MSGYDYCPGIFYSKYFIVLAIQPPARPGVPSHNISTSKMDSKPNYHKVTDHIETLDMENISMIIKSIALASRSIVAGKDTPSRVKMDELTR